MAHLGYTILFFLAAQACVIWHARLINQMIAAVNRKKPGDEAIPYSLGKRKQMKLVEAEYERLYPASRLPLLCTFSLTLGLISFLLAGIMFFKPGH